MLRTTNTTTECGPLADELTRQIQQCKTFPAIVSVQAPGLDPLAWLDAQASATRLAWCERDDDGLLVGVGQAASVVATADQTPVDVLGQCHQLIGGHESLRMFGGFSFDGQSGWNSFGSARFVLPRAILKNGELQVAVMGETDVAAALADIGQLNFDPPALDRQFPTRIRTEYFPDASDWNKNVEQALALIDQEVLEKIVLARETRLTFDGPLNPIGLTASMLEATYDCYVFCFQFDRHSAFVGATPERLFRREGRQLLSEVVAGTRPRGSSSGEDQRLAYELLTSDKDQLEHEIVRKSIRQRLHKLVDSLEVASHASVLRLARKQHLWSDVEAVLKPGVGDGDLLSRLHPTPAVGGYPTENALAEIRRLETV